MKSMFLCMLMPIWCLQAKARSGCTRFPSRRTPWLKQELIKISGRRAWHSKTFASESVRKFGAMIYIYILFGGFKHEFYFPFHIWDVILPIDELIFFKMVKTTNHIYIYKYNHINYNMFSRYLYIYGIYIYTYITPDNNLHKAWSPGSKVGISWWWDLWGRRVGLFCFWCEKHGHVITIWILPNVSKCHICQNLPYKSIS